MTSLVRLLTLCLLLATAHVAAQPRYALPDDAYRVFEQWMATTCVGDEAETAAWRARLLRHRAALLPAFRRALADGPTQETIARVRQGADRRYRTIATVPLDNYRSEGALRRPLRVARQPFVDDEAARYVAGYKSNAIAGLAVLGDTGARPVLARLAAQRDNPLATPALEALRNLDRR